MEKTLKTIQTLAKIGRILSKIIFILSIVGFCGCLAGLISLAVGFTAIQIGGVTLHSIIENKAGLTMGTLYAAMTGGMILCAAEAVLSKFAEHYFKRELADGTPFNLGGAKELLRLGILTICIPVGAVILAAIVQAILSLTLTDVVPLDMSAYGSTSLGIMMIVSSLLCKYGAEKCGNEQIR